MFCGVITVQAGPSQRPKDLPQPTESKSFYFQHTNVPQAFRRRSGRLSARSLFNHLVDLRTRTLSHTLPPRYDSTMARALDITFAALADPTRRSILAMLLEDDMAVTDVAEPFEMSLAAISKHLGVLTTAGLITQEKRGRVKWCKLEPDALRAASTWMQGFGQFEPVHLDAFERFLRTELSLDPDADQTTAP
jgi:DNA-binding transcriptional ArsR family regulator